MELLEWPTNWKCHRAFALLLRQLGLNTETIKYAWCKLQVIADYERHGHRYETIGYYPDQKGDL